MTWLSVVGGILYYISLPVTFIFYSVYWLLIAILAPIGHLLLNVVAITLWPVQWLAKFETLYIYLSVAAIVGLATGALLHFSSSLLVTLFNLSPAPEPEDKGRTAASVRAAREQRVLEAAWKTSTAKQASGTGSDSLEERYSQWLETDAGRRQTKGVAGQTILEEEDDDSMDGF